MMRRLMSWSIAGVCLLAGGSDAAAQASQETRPGMRQMMPMYDATTEATIRGTVETLDEVAPQGRMAGRGGGRSMSGTHVVLKTDKGPIAVHIGPSAFLDEHKLKIAKGDELEVLGSRVTMAGEDVVLARAITRGEQTITLRDASGRPLWRMDRE